MYWKCYLILFQYFAILLQLGCNSLQHLGREKQDNNVCNQQSKQLCSHLPSNDIILVVVIKDALRSRIVTESIYACVCRWICVISPGAHSCTTSDDGLGDFGVCFSNYCKYSDVIRIWPCQTAISKHKSKAFDLFCFVSSICRVSTRSGMGKEKRENNIDNNLPVIQLLNISFKGVISSSQI